MFIMFCYIICIFAYNTDLVNYCFYRNTRECLVDILFYFVLLIYSYGHLDIGDCNVFIYESSLLLCLPSFSLNAVCIWEPILYEVGPHSLEISLLYPPKIL